MNIFMQSGYEILEKETLQRRFHIFIHQHNFVKYFKGAFALSQYLVNKVKCQYIVLTHFFHTRLHRRLSASWYISRYVGEHQSQLIQRV